MKNSPVKDEFVCEQSLSSSYWTGMKYHVWSSQSFISWIYNDHQKNIIFEVTPFYPFMYPNAETELNYIAYEEWIKNYKPYIVKILSKKTALQWLNQANSIIEQIDKKSTIAKEPSIF